MKRKIVMFIIMCLLFVAPSTIMADFGDFDEEKQEIFNVMSKLDMQGHADHDFSTCSMQQIYFKEIEQLFAEGMTGEEVVDMYVEEYGQAALREPSTTGSGLVAWISPILIFIIGVAVVTYGMRKLTDKKAVNSGPELEQEINISEVEADILKKTFDEERRKYF